MAGGAAESRSAAKAGEESALYNMLGQASQRRMFDEAMGYGKKYREAGLAGIEAYGDLPMGMTEADMMRLTEQTDAMRAMQAAQGRRKAGGSAEQLGGLAAGAYEDAYNRYYEDLMGRANMGAQFATGAAGQAMGAGSDIASAYASGARNITPYITARGQNNASMIAAASRLGGDILNMGQSGSSRKTPKTGTDFMYGESFN
jgi:hypothetical protein